jgi:RNA polymerase sigma factor (sigma-70 family)
MTHTEFLTVWEAHGTEVWRYLLRLTHEPDTAADLWQTVAERAMRRMTNLPPDANRRAWLYRVATNAWLDELRRRSRSAPLDEEVDVQMPARDDAARLAAADLLVEVAAFVDGLPPKQRAALVLRRHHEASYAEIAAALGCSEDAARRSVHEAVRKVRAAFAGRLAEVAE